ncbi:MAG TPA: hypothetical protein VGN42_01825 [Pirellulales bacterium]|nr:hypothetical protein [Pirellulales bacterium]
MVGAGLLILVASGFSGLPEAYAQRQSPQSAGTNPDLIAFSTMVGDLQQLTIIDPQLRAMSVYHVEGDGKISLKSARRIEWDLKITQLNSAAPLPHEVRSMVQQ